MPWRKKAHERLARLARGRDGSPRCDIQEVSAEKGRALKITADFMKSKLPFVAFLTCGLLLKGVHAAETVTPDNFLRALFTLRPGTAEWIGPVCIILRSEL